MSGSAPNCTTAPASLSDLTDAQIRRIYFDWRFWARDDQLPPEQGDYWRVWLLLGGRGAGKTRAGAEWVRAQALGLWDPQVTASSGAGPQQRRIALIGETFADVRRVMIEGASGLLSVHPESERPEFEASNGRIVWPNGSVAHVFSAETPDSLRGPQFEFAWCDVFAGAMLERSGHRSTRSLRARSYLVWGNALEAPRTGCVAVLSRGSNVALGHVGFVVGETDNGLVLLGGNQRNAVTVQVFARSRLLGFRWPGDLSDDTPPTAAEIRDDDRFKAALTHVLKMEGGFSDDPYDPGGPTNFGITLQTYATYVGRTVDASSRSSLIAGLRSIDAETVRAIYRRRYWLPSYSAELPAGLDLFHFDAAVNHGVGGATRLLQEVLDLEADGEIGPITRRALLSAKVDAVINRYAALRERRYRALPHFWRFGRGWLNRVAATKVAALSQRAADPAPRALNAQSKPKLANEGVASMTDTATSTKWWGHSLTVWGAFVTAAAAILPTLGPLVGLDITSDAVRQIGSDAGAIVQAIAAFVGTIMTLYGRARATAPLVRREMNVKL